MSKYRIIEEREERRTGFRSWEVSRKRYFLQRFRSFLGWGCWSNVTHPYVKRGKTSHFITYYDTQEQANAARAELMRQAPDPHAGETQRVREIVG